MELKIEKPTDAPSRMSMILWGDAGCGKTTLAATAPGRKLFVLLDPDGDMSIRNIPDWERLNIANEKSVDIVKEGTKPDPYGLFSLLNNYDTLIIDSLTKFSEHALRHAVNVMPKSSMEAPGLNGYGARNIYVGAFVSNIIRITGQLNKHVVFVTHEKDADRNSDGGVIGVSMMLGGQLPNITSKDISEVWNMRDHGGHRYIAIRPERLRSPMKSRMFDMSGATSFEWKYNGNITHTRQGHTLSGWWDDFAAANFAKLNIPK